jgi:hypothetical protein
MISPEGVVLATTSNETPFVTVEVIGCNKHLFTQHVTFFDRIFISIY